MARVEARVRSLPPASTLFVVSRDPGEPRHVYVAGGEGFLNEILERAGGVNVFRDITRPAAEVSTEQMLSRRPDVIVELWANRPMDERARDAEVGLWSAFAVLPAVRAHRVVEITDDRLAIPGPRLPEGIRLLAAALHPNAQRGDPDTSDTSNRQTVGAMPRAPHR